MKKEEVQKKMAEKVQAINTLCEQLKVKISAEQIVQKNGMIKNVVYYMDVEEYEIDKNDEDSNLREKNG